MSQHSKFFKTLLAVAFCAVLFAQGPLAPTGGGAGPGAPGGAALAGTLLNQTATATNTTMATCPAGTTPFCTYLVGIQLECNAANPGTGTGSLSGNLNFSDNVTSNYLTQIATLNVATCNSFAASVAGNWIARYVIVKAGTAVQYQLTAAGVTGAYAYDLAWFAQRLQ